MSYTYTSRKSDTPPYPSPPLESPYGSYAMIQSGSVSSQSSHASGSHGPRSSINATYGSTSSAYSPPSYIPNSSQLDDIELDYAGPVSSKLTKSKGSSQSDHRGSGPSSHICLFPHCGYATARAYDLKRHANVHSRKETHSCPYTWCGRDEGNPFSRRDHLDEHLRKVHLKEIPKNKKRAQKGGA